MLSMVRSPPDGSKWIHTRSVCWEIMYGAMPTPHDRCLVQEQMSCQVTSQRLSSSWLQSMELKRPKFLYWFLRKIINAKSKPKFLNLSWDFGMESIPGTGFLWRILLRLTPCVIKLTHVNLWQKSLSVDRGASHSILWLLSRIYAARLSSCFYAAR